MNRPEAGTLGCVRTSGFAAKAIDLATRSRWNHIIIADGHGGCYEMSASEGARHLEVVPYADVVWLTGLPLTDFQRGQVVAYCQAEVANHTGYNWPAIVVFGARTVDPWLPHKHLDEWADRRPQQICSELGVNALRAAGVDLFPGRLAATVSPGDITELGFEKGWNA